MSILIPLMLLSGCAYAPKIASEAPKNCFENTRLRQDDTLNDLITVEFKTCNRGVKFHNAGGCNPFPIYSIMQKKDSIWAEIPSAMKVCAKSIPECFYRDSGVFTIHTRGYEPGSYRLKIMCSKIPMGTTRFRGTEKQLTDTFLYTDIFTIKK